LRQWFASNDHVAVLLRACFPAGSPASTRPPPSAAARRCAMLVQVRRLE